MAVSFGLAGQTWAADSALPLIGRISAIDGAVQYHPPEGAWAEALVNEPVAAGSGLRAAAGAEAEWRGPRARVALAPASELRVLRLDEAALQLALFSGRIGVHLDAPDSTKADSAKPDSAKTVEIDLPHGGVWLDAPGDYDIIAGDAGTPPAVQVFAGKARLGGGLDDRSLVAAAGDSFSEWWRSQDAAADPAQSPHWPGITGAQVLAANGTWERDSQWGDIWLPSNPAIEWAPYRDGVWRYLAPWGWTWIDRAPWGFAPSHYGRWARLDDRWAWVPGDKVDPADYSPAMVAFLGTAGIGLSRPGDIGAAPAVAWFPLAPRETPGDADGNYRNRRFATAVPRAAFTSGLPVADTMIDDIPRRRFVDAPVILDALSIAPDGTAGGKRPPVRLASAVSPPAANADEGARQPFVVALREAPPPKPVARVAQRVAHKKAHVAAAASRAHHLASTAHPPHNRTRLAAARGGA